MPVWPPLKLLGCLIGHYMCKFCEQNASGLSYCTNSTLWIGKKLAWSRDCLCFAARFLWKKVNTHVIPDAFQTLRFFCSGQDTKANWQKLRPPRFEDCFIHSHFHTFTFSHWRPLVEEEQNWAPPSWWSSPLSQTEGSLSSDVLWPLHAEFTNSSLASS